MNYKMYSISTAEQFHNLPEEIRLHWVLYISSIETLLRFLHHKPNQAVLLHLFAATDVRTDVLCGLQHTHIKRLTIWFKT